MFWEFQMLHFKLRLGLVQTMFCHNNLAGLVELGCSLLPCFLKMVSRQWCMRVPSRPRLDLVWTVIFDLATKGLRCGVLNGEWLFASAFPCCFSSWDSHHAELSLIPTVPSAICDIGPLARKLRGDAASKALSASMWPVHVVLYQSYIVQCKYVLRD